jgi:hypothetical protein
MWFVNEAHIYIARRPECQYLIYMHRYQLNPNALRPSNITIAVSGNTYRHLSSP